MADKSGGSERLHSIGVVCRRTGLKSDRVRAWERRYAVVAPARSDGNQRLYCEGDVRRLLLLRRVTEAGHRIAQVANLPAEELEELLELEVDAGYDRPRPRGATSPAEMARATGLVSVCLNATQQLDAEALRRRLDEAAGELSATALIQKLLVPLIDGIGELWAEGGLKVAHEHVATTVLRGFIEGRRLDRRVDDGAPHLLVTTPAGERHELGALLAVATAAECDWNVTYLGADLPAAEIAAAARQRDARAIGLSLVFPLDELAVEAELIMLRRHLGETTGLVLGGRAAPRFEALATEIGAVLVDDLIGLPPALALFA